MSVAVDYDRAGELLSCLGAVHVLMCPDTDLGLGDRDKVAQLLGFLTRELVAEQDRTFNQSSGGARVVPLRS